MSSNSPAYVSLNPQLSFWGSLRRMLRSPDPLKGACIFLGIVQCFSQLFIDRLTSVERAKVSIDVDLYNYKLQKLSSVGRAKSWVEHVHAFRLNLFRCTMTASDTTCRYALAYVTEYSIGSKPEVAVLKSRALYHLVILVQIQ